MFQDRKDYLLFHISQNHNVVYFEISKDGIEYVLDKLESFSPSREIHFKTEDLGFDNVKLKDEEIITKVEFRYAHIDSDNLVLNFDSVSKILYIFCSEKGYGGFKKSLSSLRKHILRNHPEDVSHMVDEWGGSGLLYKQILEGTDVISHLRIYNIIDDKSSVDAS